MGRPKIYATEEERKAAQDLARAKWRRANAIQIGAQLVKSRDADIIAYLETIPNQAEYIRKLIRKDMHDLEASL